MKRASIREAAWWIALNDDAGSSDALNVAVVASYISTALVADLFGTTTDKVARMVIARRRENAKAAS